MATQLISLSCCLWVTERCGTWRTVREQRSSSGADGEGAGCPRKGSQRAELGQMGQLSLQGATSASLLVTFPSKTKYLWTGMGLPSPNHVSDQAVSEEHTALSSLNCEGDAHGREGVGGS